MDISEKYMSRCLELAKNGMGNVAPNPMVGAVIVRDDVIIGEGYHCGYGTAHAEVNAIASVRDETLLPDSTMYVSLEPCSHYGKTPPCVELIIRKGIPRVIVACTDPFPEIAGRGIKMLRDAGIEVVTGVMEREAVGLNRFFMTLHRQRRPYVILKWAQSSDGFLDRKRTDRSEAPVFLSTSVTRMMAHKLRSEVQAIMVGTNTVVLDDPLLTVRYWAGNSPLRITVDNHMRIPGNARLFDGSYPVLIYRKREGDDFARLLSGENKEYKTIEASRSFVKEITDDLYGRNIASLLVEGGAQLHQSFIEENIWDEMIVETAPIKLGEGVPAVDVKGRLGLQPFDVKEIPFSCRGCGKASLIEVYTRN
ncbi:MAG: bifunctional diaminohydroxyphosphoribosylaminopyrimidine deaminase/5-amino-6-(5-phosphoribosylamino)uracil reductase RibD [Tannerella sp.]|jgi:diaminohydroxyphosphoribosylaminopyrimidine deaminase/5-amino-6-(5-phosphoribosylamino)uracil reductase|nr:bifunctional diaminohydroxyphosphoribosylaminopyrimidine deaminase/5-amino-6-(5-phosphoribosylamino)uracil reductase RibD [Tannerella sp.]